MKIAVLGATGMAGRAIVSEALARGHDVVAASRRPNSEGVEMEGHTVCAVDVVNLEVVDSLLREVDVAVFTIRLPPGDEGRLAALTRGVLDAAARHGTRILIVGGSAPLRSPSDPDRLLVDDPDYVPEAWASVARASLDQFRACTRHRDADWVYLSPPAVFEEGDSAGRYRRGTTTLLTDADGESRITPPDLATAVLDELELPGRDQHFTVIGDEQS